MYSFRINTKYQVQDHTLQYEQFLYTYMSSNKTSSYADKKNSNKIKIILYANSHTSFLYMYKTKVLIDTCLYVYWHVIRLLIQCRTIWVKKNKSKVKCYTFSSDNNVQKRCRHTFFLLDLVELMNRRGGVEIYSRLTKKKSDTHINEVNERTRHIKVWRLSLHTYTTPFSRCLHKP